MSYFARGAGVEPLIINEMSREIGPRDALVLWKLLRAMWRFKPQIIHTHKAKAGAVGRTAALLYKWLTPSTLWLRPRACRVIHTFHGHIFHSYYGPAKTNIFIFIERLLARLGTDRIIVISEQQRREIHGEFGVGRAGQVQVISLGLDFDDPPPAPGRLRTAVGLSDDKTAVGIVGRLCEVKNHALFLEAAAHMLGNLKAGDDRPHFVLIGDGHLRAELEAQAHSLGIASQVAFTGFRDDATALYADLDIVALTSLNEGTPLTLIEAMSAGRPVVATEVGGVIDLLGSRKETRGRISVWEHGVTAPSRDAEAFAEALKYLILRPELRREMGARGRAFVRARYSKERLICEISDLYKEVLSATGSKGSVT